MREHHWKREGGGREGERGWIPGAGGLVLLLLPPTPPQSPPFCVSVTAKTSKELRHIGGLLLAVGDKGG